MQRDRFQNPPIEPGAIGNPGYSEQRGYDDTQYVLHLPVESRGVSGDDPLSTQRYNPPHDYRYLRG